MFFSTRAKRTVAGGFVLLFLFLFGVYFFYGLRPISGTSQSKIFEIRRGEGFSEIAERLQNEGLIRSTAVFELYALFTGSAHKLMPGTYDIFGASSTPELIALLKKANRKINAVILDGASVYDIDKLLSERKILPSGTLREFARTHSIEGTLYPDTYEFLQYSKIDDVIGIFSKNFQSKAEPILNKDPEHFRDNLILASLVQKEVSDFKEARLVAGILKKRFSAGMTLNVDATICYLKKEIKDEVRCYPFSPGDFKIESPYNTYLHAGLPPGPIGSPESSAITAVINPLSSPYWFYLSDPKTGKTIFSKTLEEHSANRARYLR